MTDSRIIIFLQHVANVGGSGRIGEHYAFKIISGEMVSDGDTEQIDDFISMRPDQMRTENPATLLLDKRLIPVHGFPDPPRRVPVRSLFAIPLELQTLLPGFGLTEPNGSNGRDSETTLGTPR